MENNLHRPASLGRECRQQQVCSFLRFNPRDLQTVDELTTGGFANDNERYDDCEPSKEHSPPTPRADAADSIQNIRHSGGDPLGQRERRLDRPDDTGEAVPDCI